MYGISHLATFDTGRYLEFALKNCWMTSQRESGFKWKRFLGRVDDEVLGIAWKDALSHQLTGR